MFYISWRHYEISPPAAGRPQQYVNCNPVLQLSVMSVSVISLHISVMATSSCGRTQRRGEEAAGGLDAGRGGREAARGKVFVSSDRRWRDWRWRESFCKPELLHFLFCTVISLRQRTGLWPVVDLVFVWTFHNNNWLRLMSWPSVSWCEVWGVMVCPGTQLWLLLHTHYTHTVSQCRGEYQTILICCVQTRLKLQSLISYQILL